MSPEKKALGIAALSLVSAVAGGYDNFVNVVPAREAIIRNVGCDDLGLSYFVLVSRANELEKASATLDEPIRNPNSLRIIDCAKSVRKIGDASDLNPNFGLRPSLDLGALTLGGLSFIGFGVIYLKSRFKIV